MSRGTHRLRYLRIAVALLVLGGFSAAFSDFRHLLPAGLGPWLASTQLIPSFVALATGSLFALGGVLVILLTLLAGRVYCSALCPLGILQDVISRLADLVRRKPHRLPPAKPLTWLRQLFLWGTVAGVLAGWSGLTLALLDPYSNFGRIAATLFRPVLTLGNNALVDLSAGLGLPGPNRLDLAATGAGLLVLLPAAVLVLLTVMTVLRGRLFCNTICPVGTLLGFIANRAVFRLRLDQSSCTKCTECLRHCKAQCIDLRAGTIDASRCVACYDCISACDRGGINYALNWKPAPAWSTPATEVVGNPLHPLRRTFLASAAGAVASVTLVGKIARAAEVKTEIIPTLVLSGENSPAVAPPGAVSVSRFIDRCTSCQLCVTACPTQVLQPALLEYGLAGLLKPRLDYNASFCNFDCVRCAEVCPTGALDRLRPEEKHGAQIGIADFYRDRCVVVTNGTDCAACSEHCPTKAVATEPYGENLRLPVLNQDLCIGCGACEFACPVKPQKAIIVTGRRVHARAKQLVEKKAVAPKRTDDFPF
ncbi:MAG: 4Fe-4S binding protein [Lacunisphaera sp.]|nr:4Fe-4S binding protein [Lacunisphaera sp.]